MVVVSPFGTGEATDRIKESVNEIPTKSFELSVLNPQVLTLRLAGTIFEDAGKSDPELSMLVLSMDLIYNL